ncbi:hypothetical protein NUW54_g840 [Trametes sanguinea]|uniref:Uncharacterized protein n=1 Tax=Trametes sanguinea TaxID=158606 RepID=A0ACC1Q9I0_9APHY|nr:hypothetical protein NUW54_g840 [Trametes sanguinea]
MSDERVSTYEWRKVNVTRARLETRETCPVAPSSTIPIARRLRKQRWERLSWKGRERELANVRTPYAQHLPCVPRRPKTFYVDGKYAADVNLRESIVALLDLADEQLECNALVIALERSSPVLGDLLHSLMYVGGTVVTKPPFPVDPSYVLVGMEI